jgi:hypothetical protein
MASSSSPLAAPKLTIVLDWDGVRTTKECTMASGASISSARSDAFMSDMITVARGWFSSGGKLPASDPDPAPLPKKRKPPRKKPSTADHRPPQPASVYVRFSRDARDGVFGTPALDHKEVGALWRKLSYRDKLPYEDAYKADMAAYSGFSTILTAKPTEGPPPPASSSEPIRPEAPTSTPEPTRPEAPATGPAPAATAPAPPPAAGALVHEESRGAPWSPTSMLALP